jgi:acetyltransferase
MNSETVAEQSWEALFYPSSVAVVGASANRSSPGGNILEKLKTGGFNGKVYPVNPKYKKLAGWDCFPEITSVPGPVDLAVLSVQYPQVEALLEACGRKGVKAVIVFSSGFGEVDSTGQQRQQRIKEIADRFGLRVVGPNSMGVISFHHKLHACFTYDVNTLLDALTLSGKMVDAGIALVSQSGGVGYTLLTKCAAHGLKASFFVSSGNEAVTDFADYLFYFVQHPEVKIIAAYLEGVRDGPKLGRAAEEAAAAGKPLVILKVGKHEASARAARSHTGSLAGSSAVYKAFFRQKGIIEVERTEEMVATLAFLAAGRKPAGKKVAILASSGGHAVLAADSCAKAGLEVAELTARTRAFLAENLPPYAATANPVDFTGLDLVSGELLGRCAAAIAADENVDMLFLLHQMSAEVNSDQQLRELTKKTGKPLILAGFDLGLDSAGVTAGMMENGIACVSDAEAGAKSAANVIWYLEKSRKVNAGRMIKGNPPEILQSYRLQKPGSVFSERETKKLLAAYGIPVVPELPAATEKEAVAAASQLGYPVVLKVDSPQIAHKTEVGGVILNIGSPDEVGRAFAFLTGEVARRVPEASIRGVLVQKMLRGGLEVLVGLNRDPVFGPVLTFGLGGVWVEILKDVSMRVLPVTEDDLREMIFEIRGYPLLEGARGRAPADRQALIGALLNLARLGQDWPELAELDVNPLYVLPAGEGVYALDAFAVLAV